MGQRGAREGSREEEREGKCQVPALCPCASLRHSTASPPRRDSGVAFSAPHNTAFAAAEQNYSPNLPLSAFKTLMSMLASPNSPLLTLQCSASGVPQAACFAFTSLVFCGIYIRDTGFSMRKRHKLLMFVVFFPCKMLIVPISMLIRSEVSSQC